MWNYHLLLRASRRYVWMTEQAAQTIDSTTGDPLTEIHRHFYCCQRKRLVYHWKILGGWFSIMGGVISPPTSASSVSCRRGLLKILGLRKKQHPLPAVTMRHRRRRQVSILSLRWMPHNNYPTLVRNEKSRKTTLQNHKRRRRRRYNLELS